MVIANCQDEPEVDVNALLGKLAAAQIDANECRDGTISALFDGSVVLTKAEQALLDRLASGK